ncbi:L,D-transpeptidase [Bacillus sp. Marseille-P3661]|uniref:L,D-transpeptidase n=1 Tax=Bacillus sp. Marseille-P3661 TaxID=1936234 RepID=UPI0027E5B9B3|nr:L,D-transpeptidase [Bacillus sp. Marseille-P3661]
MIRKSFFSAIVICLTLLFFTPQQIAYGDGNQAYIIINKAINKLAYFDKGQLIKIFDVGTGRTKSLTPEGEFSIINMVKNRPYYKEKIPGGSPKNPLGDRWMGLSVPGTWGHTYGIHGNNNENSIGKYVSAGCVRMHNSDVRWLFDQIGTGTKVLITDSNKDFESLALENGYELKQPVINKVDKKITAFETKNLYTKPFAYEGYQNGAILPQTVTAYEETDTGWYHIKTWYGDAWITQDDTVEGVLEQVTEEILLSAETTLYERPDGTVVLGALAPQPVKAFEKLGNWYRVYTWFGDAWIKSE